MRIVCPTCDTAYNAPESVVAAGRPLRCAKCRTEWTPGTPVEEAAFANATPPAPARAQATEAEPDSAPVRRAQHAEPEPDAPPLAAAPKVPFPLAVEPPAEPELVILAPFPDVPSVHPPPRRAVMAAWAASVLVLIVAFWLVIAFRQPIVRHWPPAARLLGAAASKQAAISAAGP